MDTTVIQRVLQALDLVYNADTPAGQRRQAEEFCQQLRNDASASAYGVHLATAANGYPPTTRHFGLQLIEHSLANRKQQEAEALRQPLWELLWQSMQEPAYIREKLVAIVVMLVIRLWPSTEWADLSQQLMQMYGASAAHRETVLRIWQTLGEEMFVYDRDAMATVRKHDLTNGIVGALLPRPVVAQLYPGGYRLATDTDSDATRGPRKKATAIPVEAGNEDGWLYRWSQHAIELAAAYDESSEPLLLSLIATISTFMDWIPIKALVATGMAGQLAQLLLAPSDQVRIQAAAALETISRRNSGTGDERDLILVQFAQDQQAAVLRLLMQCYAATLDESSWADGEAALTAAKTVSSAVSNLVTMHWARKKIEANALSAPQPLLELLLKISQDTRYTVSTLALNSWAAIIKHDALSKTPEIASTFSVLTEYTTKALFDVCRLTQLLSAAGSQAVDASCGISEDEAEQFESVGELRAFLSNDVRSRLLAIIRGMCVLDPSGFVGWIMPSLAPVFGQPSTPAAVAEAALMIVDSILSTLDDFEQRALADGDAAQLEHVQSARQPCYQLGNQVVGFATTDVALLTRQLQTLPSFAFLLRPALMGSEDARTLLLAVLHKCIGHLKFAPTTTGAALRDLRQVARRATSALVKLALAIPDSLMHIYADLSQMVANRLADPAVAITVKSYLSEFQLTLVAGASCTLAQRRELAQPVVQPIVATLHEFMPAFQTPQDFAAFLGLPFLDQAYATQAASDDVRAGLAAARERRNRLSHTLSTLQICLLRTLGAASGDLRLAGVWGDYIADLAPALLLIVRSLHALWNPAHWQTMQWQSAQAAGNLFGILEMSHAERLMITGGASGEPLQAEQALSDPLSVESRAVHHALATFRDHAYRSLGRLLGLREMFDEARLPGLASNFTGCLFADVGSLEPRHWRFLLAEVVRPALETVGNWPGMSAADVEKDGVDTLARFLPAWLPPLFDFCSHRLQDEWQAVVAEDSRQESVEEDMVREKLLRDWTRAWSHVLVELLGSLSLWIPEASRIHHDMMHAARISAHPSPSSLGGSVSSEPGSTVGRSWALGAFVLRSPAQMLAGVLTASLRMLRFAKDTQSVDRVLGAVAEIAPAFVLLALAPRHLPPSPAHASTASAYLSRIAAGSLTGDTTCTVSHALDAWLTTDLAATLVGVLRDPFQIDSQDAALVVLGDLLYYAASFSRHMQPSWTPRDSSGANELGDPGRVLWTAVLRAAAAATGVLLADLEIAAEQVVEEADSRRRKALLRVAMLPALAVEKSQMFGGGSNNSKLDKAKKTIHGKRAGGVGVPDEWTNRSQGARGDLLGDGDGDEHFDLAALIP
ncbi:karyopherin [Coemansia sp. RSA 2599]|nr:karyopherin [Coemansia sp. RSA 2598]KAJ1829047.1 karyopherin [Coemansia sp. RSA 2599]